MDTNSIKPPQVVAFIDSHELAVVRQALAAMRDAVDLKAELGLPLHPETMRAVTEMEDMIASIRLSLLRHHPDQLELPLGLPAKEGKHEAGHNDASRPAELTDVWVPDPPDRPEKAYNTPHYRGMAPKAFQGRRIAHRGKDGDRLHDDGPPALMNGGSSPADQINPHAESKPRPRRSSASRRMTASF